MFGIQRFQLARRSWFRYLLAVLLGASGALQPGQVAQAAPETTIVLTLDQRAARVDGSTVTLDTAPLLDAGTSRTFVPVRFIGETLGAYIGWNAEDQEVTYLTGDTRISLWIGREEAEVNGRAVPLDAAPYIDANNRTLVPVRFVSEQMGAVVDFDGASSTITIKAPWVSRVILIQDFTFTPATLEIKPGTRVTWVNLDDTTHNIVGPNMESPFLEVGDAFSYTFSQAGTFTYVCTFHHGMTGTIQVR